MKKYIKIDFTLQFSNFLGFSQLYKNIDHCKVSSFSVVHFLQLLLMKQSKVDYYQDDWCLGVFKTKLIIFIGNSDMNFKKDEFFLWWYLRIYKLSIKRKFCIWVETVRDRTLSRFSRNRYRYFSRQLKINLTVGIPNVKPW